MTVLGRRRAQREAQRLIAAAHMEAEVIRSQAYALAEEILDAARAAPRPASSTRRSSFAELWAQTAEPVNVTDDFFTSTPNRVFDFGGLVGPCQVDLDVGPFGEGDW